MRAREEQLGLNSELIQNTPYPTMFWVQKETEDVFIRVLPTYSSKAAHLNIQSHRYRQQSTIFNYDLIQVPRKQIHKVYRPTDRLNQILHTFQKGTFSDKQALDSVERQALEAALCISELYEIPVENMGLTGSILWNAQHNLSDIDLVLYGLDAVKKYLAVKDAPNSDQRGIRSFKKIELLPLAEKMIKRTGLPLEECFEYQYRKPHLLFHNDRRVSISFVPTINELIKFPAYVLESQFNSFGKVIIRAKLKTDTYEFFLPGILEIDTTEIVVLEHKEDFLELQPKQITRVMIFEQEFIGYYKTGDLIEISGLLQYAKNIPAFSGFDLINTYQVMIGGHETYGREYIRLLKNQ